MRSGVAIVDGRNAGTDEIPADVRDGTGRGIIETMRVARTTIPQLARHVMRMRASARMLGFPVPDAVALRHWIDDAVTRHGSDTARIRVTLLADGRVVVEATPIPPLHVPVRLATVAANALPEHKFLDRRAYACDIPDAVDQPLFVSRSGHVQETDRANIFVVLGGRLATPRAVGILPGVARGAIVDALGASEEDVPTSAIADAEEIFLTNALRGVIAIERVDALIAPQPASYGRVAADVLGFAPHTTSPP